MLIRMRTALASIIILLLLAWSGAAADLTGTWLGDVQTDAGSGTPTFVLKQDGDKLSGTYSGQLGEAKLTGTVKGTAVQFGFSLSQGGDSIEIKYEGEVQADGTMKGKVAFGTMASGTWTAKKK